MLDVLKFGGVAAVMALSGGRLCPGCDGAVAGADSPAVADVQASDTAIVRFAIAGMTCGTCATTARVALQRLEGVYRATISYDSASAVVSYDPGRVTPQRMAEHLRQLTGYRATVVAEAPRPDRTDAEQASRP